MAVSFHVPPLCKCQAASQPYQLWRRWACGGAEVVYCGGKKERRNRIWWCRWSCTAGGAVPENNNHPKKWFNLVMMLQALCSFQEGKCVFGGQLRGTCCCAWKYSISHDRKLVLLHLIFKEKWALWMSWIFDTVQHGGDDSLPAVDRDRSILPKLLLGFMHLANEINESLPGFRHALLRPISKLELPYCPGLAILQTQSA